MSALLIESHFLPCLEYFCAIAPHPTIVLEAHEHYVKQTCRNRCYVLAVRGPQRLTVPLTGKRGKALIKDVRLDYTTRWQANFWRSISSAYANAPYFEHYEGELHNAMFSHETFLFDLNLRLLSMCLNWLKWKKDLTISPGYQDEPSHADLRNVITDTSEFANRGFYRPAAYQQVFGKAFVPNLSLLDLVSCTGPDAGRILHSSSAFVNK
jgi:hypothetical protein